MNLEDVLFGVNCIVKDKLVAQDLHKYVAEEVGKVVYASTDNLQEHAHKYWEYYSSLMEQELKRRGYEF